MRLFKDIILRTVVVSITISAILGILLIVDIATANETNKALLIVFKIIGIETFFAITILGLYKLKESFWR